LKDNFIATKKRLGKVLEKELLKEALVTTTTAIDV